MQEVRKNNFFTSGDIIALLHSVLSLTVTIYPDSYETDRKLFEVIKPKLKKGGTRLKRKFSGEVFNLTIREMLILLDMKYGFRKWMSDFASKFDVNEGIEANYDRLVRDYSSVEIIIFYRIFPNLANIGIQIYSGNDERPERTKNATVMRLPDAEIDAIEVVLREHYSQEIVDIINRFCIANGTFRNDGMSRSFTTLCDTVKDFHNVLRAISEWSGNEELLKILVEPIGFTEISEINDCAVIITTDYPDL